MLLQIAALVAPAILVGARYESIREFIDGSLARWIDPKNDRGDAPGDQKIEITVYLALRDPQGAAAAATAVSDPASASYGKFLTPSQFKAAYAASDQTTRVVRDWLTGQGFDVAATSPTNRSIRVRGSISVFETAFSSDVRAYDHDGSLVYAPAEKPSVPADVAHAVMSLGSLGVVDEANQVAAPVLPAYVRPPVCSVYFAESYPADDRSIPAVADIPDVYGGTPPLAGCGYTARQVRKLYGTDDLVEAGVDGRGTTVAIVGAYASPTIVADVNTWAARQGEPPLSPRQYREYLPPVFFHGYADRTSGDVCREQVWYSEQTLDVQAVRGMAPGVDVVYVAASSCQISDMTDALQRVVDERLADAVSGSFSFREAEIPAGDVEAAHATFVQAAIEGVGMYFSSGDRGDNISENKVRGVEYPASDPMVTGVGGTSVGISSAGTRIFELGWQTSTTTLADGSWLPAAPGEFLAGGGGGVSEHFGQPRYQVGVVPTAVSAYFGGRPGRSVPDVAALADPHTGYLVGQTEAFSDGSTGYVEYRLGGTSLATPLFAGIMALAGQLACRPIGFANYALYQLAGTPAYYDPASSNRTTAVVDVYYTNDENPAAGYGVALRTFNQEQTINLREGYDDVTGIGTPNGFALVGGVAGIARC